MSQVGEFIQKVGNMAGNATGYNQYQVDQGMYMPTEQEQTLTNALMAQAMGKGGPSAAELQMKAGGDQATANANAVAAAQRGVSPALAARQAQQFGAETAQKANQQAGILRAQEQLNAQQTAGSLLGSQRNARMQAAGINAAGFENAADRSQGLIRSVGSAFAGMAHGGEVMPHYAEGGMMPSGPSAPGDFLNALATSIGQSIGQEAANSKAARRREGADMSGFASKVGSFMDSGSGGFTGSGGGAGPAAQMTPGLAHGGYVPGQVDVPGDSEENDKVPTMLSPGEIVVPRTVAKMSPDEITQFIMAIKKGA